MKRSIGTKAAVLMTAAIFSISALLTACGGTAVDTASPDGGKAPAAKAGTVNVSGAPVEPLVQNLIDAFKGTNPDITINLKENDAAQGIKDVSGGTSDIGVSSRELTSDEKSLGLTENPIAYGGVAVIVSPNNTVSNLSKDQLTKIFKGEITNWKDAGGADGEIMVVNDSEVAAAFEGKLGIEISENALALDGSGAVKAIMASNENAVGFASLGSVDDTVKKVSIDNVECTADSLKSNTYPITMPVILVTKGEPRPEVKAFLDFLLGAQGQEIVGKAYAAAK